MKHLILILILAMTPATAQANDAMRDRIIRELRDDGYTDIRIFRTFLGRLRFIARDDDTRREIVLNPATGVILRDYLRVLDTGTGSSSSGSANSGGGAMQSGSDDDGYDDDDDNDDDDDDDDGGSDDGGSDSDDGGSDDDDD